MVEHHANKVSAGKTHSRQQDEAYDAFDQRHVRAAPRGSGRATLAPSVVRTVGEGIPGALVPREPLIAIRILIYGTLAVNRR